jgi:hypothetical protein
LSSRKPIGGKESSRPRTNSFEAFEQEAIPNTIRAARAPIKTFVNFILTPIFVPHRALESTESISPMKYPALNPAFCLKTRPWLKFSFIKKLSVSSVPL